MDKENYEKLLKKIKVFEKNKSFRKKYCQLTRHRRTNKT